MKKQQSGFTLIELIMVIVILGILAAVAIPKFIDLSTEAETAAVQGVAGALGAASAINYAVSKTSAGHESVGDCEDVADALEGGLPTGYVITAAAITSAAGSVSCTVTSPSGIDATFVGHYAP